jgi:hypothetical protein
VKLGRPLNRVRHRPRSHKLLLNPLASIVSVTRDPVDTHDREHNVLLDARTPRRRQHVPSPGGEQLPGLLDIRAPHVGDVDNGLDTGQRLVQPLAGQHVDAERACHDDRLMPRPLAGGNRMATDEPCSTDDSDPQQSLQWRRTNETTRRPRGVPIRDDGLLVFPSACGDCVDTGSLLSVLVTAASLDRA